MSETDAERVARITTAMRQSLTETGCDGPRDCRACSDTLFYIEMAERALKAEAELEHIHDIIRQSNEALPPPPQIPGNHANQYIEGDSHGPRYSRNGKTRSLEDKALRFDLDQAGIADREAGSIELVELRARVNELEAERCTVVEAVRKALNEAPEHVGGPR